MVQHPGEGCCTFKSPHHHPLPVLTRSKTDVRDKKTQRGGRREKKPKEEFWVSNCLEVSNWGMEKLFGEGQLSSEGENEEVL